MKQHHSLIFLSIILTAYIPMMALEDHGAPCSTNFGYSSALTQQTSSPHVSLDAHNKETHCNCCNELLAAQELIFTLNTQHTQLFHYINAQIQQHQENEAAMKQELVKAEEEIKVLQSLLRSRQRKVPAQSQGRFKFPTAEERRNASISFFRDELARWKGLHGKSMDAQKKWEEKLNAAEQELEKAKEHRRQSLHKVTQFLLDHKSWMHTRAKKKMLRKKIPHAERDAFIAKHTSKEIVENLAKQLFAD